MTIQNRVLGVALAAALLLSTGITGREAVDLHKLDQMLRQAVEHIVWGTDIVWPNVILPR